MSGIQSLNSGFGSGVTAGDTGVLLNNRMAYWHLAPGHANRLAPGKRVRHTMNAPMVFKDDKLWAVEGTPGADNQVQVNLQVLTSMMDLGADPQSALEAPRWTSSQQGQGANWPHEGDGSLTIEPGFGEDVLAGLERLGHRLNRVGPLEGPCSVQAIRVDGERRARGRFRSAPRRLGRGLLKKRKFTAEAQRRRRRRGLTKPPRPLRLCGELYFLASWNVPMWNSAWTLLILANLFWAGNIVLGRGLAGHVPPIALAYWRWTGAFLIAFGFAWPYLKQDAPVLLRHWRMMLLLSATGIATYNTMSYIGLTDTTALNVLLLQSAGPLVIILWAFALFGERPTVWQSAGVLLSLVGVAVIAAHGSLEVLLHLSLNRGDVWILVAMVIYGVYAAMFRRRPAAHPLSFLVATMGIGSMMILPFYAVGDGAGRPDRGRPAVLARDGLYRGVPVVHRLSVLQPRHRIDRRRTRRPVLASHAVFGSILAVLFLDETFYAYHAIGIAMIAAGILLASIKTTPRITRRCPSPAELEDAPARKRLITAHPAPT